jgi:hypothetical protein
MTDQQLSGFADQLLGLSLDCWDTQIIATHVDQETVQLITPSLHVNINIIPNLRTSGMFKQNSTSRFQLIGDQPLAKTQKLPKLGFVTEDLS